MHLPFGISVPQLISNFLSLALSYSFALSHTHIHTVAFIHTMKATDLQHTSVALSQSQNGELVSSSTAARPVHHSGSCFKPNSSTTVVTSIAHSSNMSDELILRQTVEVMRRHFVLISSFCMSITIINQVLAESDTLHNCMLTTYLA